MDLIYSDTQQNCAWSHKQENLATSTKSIRSFKGENVIRNKFSFFIHESSTEFILFIFANTKKYMWLDWLRRMQYWPYSEAAAAGVL